MTTCLRSCNMNAIGDYKQYLYLHLSHNLCKMEVFKLVVNSYILAKSSTTAL